MISLDGEDVLSNFCIYRPELYFIYYDHFRDIYVNHWI